MHKRLLVLVLTCGLLFSLTACDMTSCDSAFRYMLGSFKKAPSESSMTEETTTTEVTTTTEEEATSEETTSEETTTEETTSEETTTEAPTATPKPTKAPTKKPSATPTYIPKGWSKVKEAWGKKYKGKKVYVVRKAGSFKGWYNGAWINLYMDSYTIDDTEEYHVEGIQLFRDKKQKKMYVEFQMKT